jgi:hypothetical protein
MHKFILPSLWVATVIVLFVARPLYSRFAGADALIDVGWAGPLLALAFLYWTYILFECLQLKRVDLVGDVLRVSNFREEIEIPLPQIESVSASAFVTPELIWLHLRRPTMFGDTLVFAAPIRFLGGFWQRHPLAEELRHRISVAGARSPTSWFTGRP